jgi:hypothetical protein
MSPSLFLVRNTPITGIHETHIFSYYNKAFSLLHISSEPLDGVHVPSAQEMIRHVEAACVYVYRSNSNERPLKKVEEVLSAISVIMVKQQHWRRG